MGSISMDTTSTHPDCIAIELLELRQRLDALDRLYNEDINAIQRELARLNADYVRLYQTQSSPSRRKRLRS